MSRAAKVFYQDNMAGILSETDKGYQFVYDKGYLLQPDSRPISLTLPLRLEPYDSKTFFAFFDGLMPEGWILEIAVDHWKLNRKDRFGLLLATGRDTIGAVSVISIDDENESI